MKRKKESKKNIAVPEKKVADKEKNPEQKLPQTKDDEKKKEVSEEKTKNKNLTITPKRKKGKSKKAFITFSVIFAAIVSTATYFLTYDLLTTSISFPVAIALAIVYGILRTQLKESDKIKKMENSFPDFLQLMASNLRAGITTDKALLLSARKEFAPLDAEILQLGKDLVTGKKIEQALEEMAQRIKSQKIKKTIELITSGIKTGGNLATLLEETAENLKEREFVEKKSSSNVLMYVIFIFFAAAIGAPALFGLSSTLVQVLTDIFANIPDLDQNKISLPFTLTKITISTTFINYFSFIFLVCIDILAALVIGIVQKGEEKAGVKFMIPLLAISLSVYFTVKFFLASYFSDFLS